MIATKFDDAKFMKDMNNIIQYSVGYLEGIQKGKNVFLKNIGSKTIELLKEYIDANARVDQAMLHHVYEWNQTGSPNSRLFDIEYTISNLGLSIKSTFRQSSSIQEGSTTPFFDKAKIMENGIPVVIRPKNRKVLSFEIDGEQVFTNKPITVTNPGGPLVQGGYEQTFDNFFNNYFSQAFLKSSGIMDYLQSPTLYKKNLSLGKSSGKVAGIETGYRWIANGGKE